jgi:hypothetical protein
VGLFSNRRNRIVEKHLRLLIAAGVSDAELPDLYFEAACGYAKDNGGKQYPDSMDSIIFDKVIDGQNYSIFFLKIRRGGGTSVTLTESRPSFEIARENAEEYVRWAAASHIDDLVLDSINTNSTIKRKSITEGKIREFFEFRSTSIPSKCESIDGGAVFFGFVNVRGVGIISVMSAVIGREVIINANASQPLTEEFFSSKRDIVLSLQDEYFEEFKTAILEEYVIPGT